MCLWYVIISVLVEIFEVSKIIIKFFLFFRCVVIKIWCLIVSVIWIGKFVGVVVGSFSVGI